MRALFFLAQEGSLAALLLASLLVVARSLQRADWAETPSLMLATTLGLITAMVLTSTKRSSFVRQILGVAAGTATALWLVSPMSLSRIGLPAFAETAVRVWAWVHAGFSGGLSADVLPFSFFLTFSVWLTAYASTWLVLRRRSFWAPVLITGSILIVNMSFLQESNKAEFFLFLLPALLLRVRLRSLEGSTAGKAGNGRRTWATLRNGALFAGAIMASGFMMPSGKDLPSLDGLYTALHSPIERYGVGMDRLFAGLYARVPGGVRVFSDRMALGGTVQLSDVPSLIVESQTPVYLRARAYDTYSAGGWSTSETEVYQHAANGSSETVPGREFRQVTVTPLFPSSLKFITGQLEQISQASQVEAFVSPAYVVNLRNTIPNNSLPESIMSAARSLQYAVRPSGARRSQNPPTLRELQELLPADIVLNDLAYERGVPVTATLMRSEAGPPDIVSVRATEASPLDEYTLTVSFSSAGPAELRASSNVYPRWIADRYLQLPSKLPASIGDLAKKITAGATNPYDKATAIESYLRTNIEYSLVMDPPPYNSDSVEYFLFAARKGYCDYFASAMAVMLRTQGVPARVVSGFAPGEKAGDNKFLVRDRDAHSWPQVYFMGEGWIDFEPTPGGASSVPEQTVPQPEETQPDDLSYPVTLDEEDFWTDDFPTVPATATDSEPSTKAVWLPFLFGFGLLTLVIWGLWRMIGAVPNTARAGFGRLCAFGKLAGIPPRSSQTPYEYARSVGLSCPEAREQVWKIADTYVRQSYGKGKTSLTDEQARKDWATIRAVFLRRLLRLRRR